MSDVVARRDFVAIWTSRWRDAAGICHRYLQLYNRQEHGSDFRTVHGLRNNAVADFVLSSAAKLSQTDDAGACRLVLLAFSRKSHLREESL